MPASWISAGAAAIGAISSVKNKGGGGGASAAADPFAAERPQYMDALQKLMKEGFSEDYGPTDPSYKFRFNQGMEAVNRSMAASGLLNSGNRIAALVDYGQGQASTEYANQFQRLAQLSGANIGSPSVAAQMQYQQQGNASAGIQSLGNAAANFLNTKGSSGQTYGQQASNWFSGLFGGGGGSGGGSSSTAGSFADAFGGDY